MMKNRLYIKIPGLLILCFAILSCEKEDVKTVIKPDTCNVEIEDFCFWGEGEGGLKDKNIQRENDTPIDVKGYKVTVKNLDFSVDDISETFHYLNGKLKGKPTDKDKPKPNNKDKEEIENVYVGDNRFIAESFGGEENIRNAWYSISRLNNEDEDQRVAAYASAIKSSYHLYTKYRDEKTVTIRKGKPQSNRFSFNMEPVNGCLAIVIENDFYRGFKKDDEYIMVKIEGKEIKMNVDEVQCFIFNTDLESPRDIPVEIRCYNPFGGIHYHIKDIFLPEDGEPDLRYEPGKFKVRLIKVVN